MPRSAPPLRGPALLAEFPAPLEQSRCVQGGRWRVQGLEGVECVGGAGGEEAAGVTECNFKECEDFEACWGFEKFFEFF